MRLNITLPDTIGKELKTVPNKSSYIAEALKEKIMCEKRARIAEELACGYKAARKEDAGIDREWEESTMEGWE